MATANPVNQSAISEARDQLFLDTADQSKLDIVGENLGLTRPSIGQGDDAKWRATIKKIALKPGLITQIFHDILSICFGPQYSKVNVLDEIVSAGESILTLTDASSFIQTGTLILDPGLATEETVNFEFRDLRTNEIFLKTTLQFDHDVVEYASNRLRSDIIVGAVALPLMDSSQFPTSGFPYPVLIDRNTESEEVVTITANTLATNTLTCSATTKAHKGPHTPLVKKDLNKDAPAGRTFLQFLAGDTKAFPASGFVNINRGGVNYELAEFTSNDGELGVLYLKVPLTNSHVAGEPVDLVEPGALVDVASIWQPGSYWQTYETQNKKLYVFLPETLKENRLIDASWLHDPTPAAFSTTVATGFPVGSTDTEVNVSSALGFPDEGALFEINNAQVVFYIFKDYIEAEFAESVLAGATSIIADDVSEFPTNTLPYDIRLGEGTVNDEVVSATAIDPDTNTITVAPTANPHAADELISKYPAKLVLDREIGNAYAAGDPVDLFEVPYAGTDLEEGNPRTAGGMVQTNYYPGPYVYEPGTRGVSVTSTTLATAVAPATTVAQNQDVGYTNLEVVDASLWPTSNYTARIGRTSGFAEDSDVVDRTLKQGLSTTVAAPDPIIGDFTLTCVSTAGFPEGIPAGYRIIIDQGGANEEIIKVSSNDTGTNTFTFVTALTIDHAIGETVELLNDVITFDQLTQPHKGSSISPSKLGHLVEPLISSLDLAAGGSFPTTGGYIYLNFGKEKNNAKSTIDSIIAANIYQLETTDLFPTGDFPYQVILGVGLPTEERINVSANNTILDRLTFATVPVNAHAVGETVEFISGITEIIRYNSRSGNTINITVPVVSSKHVIGERVILSAALSEPVDDGSSYPLHTSPDPAACFIDLFDLVRAAGVEIEVLDNR